MIKTEYRLYRRVYEWTRNEIVRMIVKQPQKDWGKIILGNTIDVKTKWRDFDPVLLWQGEELNPQNYSHSFKLSHTQTGTLIISVEIVYSQAIEVATDKPDWIAYRHVDFNPTLTDDEIDTIDKIWKSKIE